MQKESKSIPEHGHEEKKIYDIIILFSYINTNILMGQIESIVQNNTHLKVLENWEMERRRLAILILECTGDLPKALLYELDFSTLLIDYAIYEMKTTSGNTLKEG